MAAVIKKEAIYLRRPLLNEFTSPGFNPNIPVLLCPVHTFRPDTYFSRKD